MRKKFFVLTISVLILTTSISFYYVSDTTEGLNSIDGKISIDEARINNNTALRQFVEKHNISGEGSEDDPFLIKNRTFENRVFLENIDLHTKIIESVITNSSSEGIRLNKVNNITIKNNIFENVSTGIRIEDSSKNTIKSNLIRSVNRWGIRIIGYSRDNFFYKNNLENCSFSVSELENTETRQIIPENNSVNGYPVFYLQKEKTLPVPDRVGQIIIVQFEDIEIENVSLTNATSGIQIIESNKVSLENISIRDQNAHGVYIDKSENISIENSLIKNNKIGIELRRSANNTLKHNRIINNYDNGIVLSSTSTTLDLEDQVGGWPTKNNSIIENQINNTGGYAIELRGFAYNNSIFLNIIEKNRKDAVLNEEEMRSQAIERLSNESLSNDWYSEKGLGNYWGEFIGSDENRDGIIDEHYHIDGSESVDKYPLSSKVGPPTNFEALPRDGKVILDWNMPRYSLFSPIENLTIYRGREKENITFLKNIGDEKNGYVDENVTNNVEYFYKMRAQNKKYESISTSTERAIPDGDPPEVVDYFPADEVPIDSNITVVFSEEMDEDSVDISIENVNGTIEKKENNKFIFRPIENFTYNKEYTVHITGKDIAGNTLEGDVKSWSFTTESMGLLTGKILDEDLEPLKDVEITCDKDNRVFTDSEGEFELTLLKGSRTIRFYKEGYIEEEITIEITPREEIILKDEYGDEMVLEQEEDLLDVWFWPLVLIGGMIALLGIITISLFLIKAEEEEISETDLYEDEEYENITQEEFESWWDEE